MLFSGTLFYHFDGPTMLQWGANSRDATLDGEPWRLLTCCFLHWGALHLFMNMLALYLVGLYLEPHLNKEKITVAYLLTGIVASATSLYYHEQGISAGASGAIFSLYGVFIALLTTNLIEPIERNKWLPSMILFIGYNLLGGMKGNIDNAAHIGGLISGVLIGYCIYPWLKGIKI